MTEIYYIFRQFKLIFVALETVHAAFVKQAMQVSLIPLIHTSSFWAHNLPCEERWPQLVCVCVWGELTATCNSTMPKKRSYRKPYNNANYIVILFFLFRKVEIR